MSTLRDGEKENRESFKLAKEKKAEDRKEKHEEHHHTFKKDATNAERKFRTDEKREMHNIDEEYEDR